MNSVSATETYLNESPVAPLFSTSVMVQNWGTNQSGAFGRLKFIDTVIANNINPFKGCSTFKSNPQRIYIVLVGKFDTLDDVLYSGEATLKNWSDGPKGSWFEVYFSQRPENRDWNPLAGTEAHNMSGEHVNVIAWFLDDEEQRVASVDRKPIFSYSHTSPVKQSQVKCRQDRDFQKWCHKLAKRMKYDVPHSLTGAEYASEVVKLYLNVKSRAVMSEDTLQGQQARERWRDMERMYFLETHAYS